MAKKRKGFQRKNSPQKQSRQKIKKNSRWHAVPLKGSFMVTAILGFLLSYYYVLPVSYSFGAACIIIFTLMFVAALVSMTKSPLVAAD